MSVATFTDYEPLEIRVGDFKIEWLHRGEGNGGKRYEPATDDHECLRFVCYEREDEYEPFAELEGFSFCTYLVVGCSDHHLMAASMRVLEVLQSDEEWEEKRRQLDLLGYTSRESCEEWLAGTDLLPR